VPSTSTLLQFTDSANCKTHLASWKKIPEVTAGDLEWATPLMPLRLSTFVPITKFIHTNILIHTIFTHIIFTHAILIHTKFIHTKFIHTILTHAIFTQAIFIHTIFTHAIFIYAALLIFQVCSLLELKRLSLLQRDRIRASSTL